MVYPTFGDAETGLRVTFRKAGVWTDPISVLTDVYATSFAAGANKNVPDGLVVVVSPADSGLVAIDVSESAGVAAPVLFDTPDSVYARTIAVAPGICGDDAEIEYNDLDGLKVARVKGTDSTFDVVVPKSIEYLDGAAILTRSKNPG